MKHSKEDVLKAAGMMCDKLIALEADVQKELGAEGSSACDELKYRLADIVYIARLITSDLSDIEEY